MNSGPSMPPPAPPPPPPRPIPVATDPTTREAQLAAEKSRRKRKGRQSTLLSGALGDGEYSDEASATVGAGVRKLLGGAA